MGCPCKQQTVQEQAIQAAPSPSTGTLKIVSTKPAIQGVLRYKYQEVAK